MRRALHILPLALVAFAGCGFSPFGQWPGDAGVVACTNDSQCAEGQVCFVDGCGDPGENLVVEVVPQQGSGEAQDFELRPGELRAYQIIDLYPPSLFQGEIARGTLNGADPYLGNVAISIRGESALIPGVRRRYDAVSTANASTYSAQVGAGVYTVTARATDDLTVPPVVIREVLLQPGQTLNVPLLFPGPLETFVLQGLLLGNPEGAPVQASLDLQVLDQSTGEALSQRVPISVSGEFSVTAQLPRGEVSDVVVQVTSREPGALVPRRQFTVNLLDGLVEPLLFGDFGSAVSVSGRVVDAADKPVSGARVSLAGTATNGGTLQSAAALTGVDGTFQLQTLAGAPDETMTLTILPAPEAAAGLTVAQVTVPYVGGNLGKLTALDRPAVVGRVRRPDNTTPAAGVRMVAEPVGVVDTEPLPSAIVEARSDMAGEFTLRLDPAVYRLDLFPGENLPRISRFATVRRGVSGGTTAAITLPDFQLSSGRTVEGVITIRQQGVEGVTTPAGNATIRFFRRTPYESGQPGALLLAEGVANTSGEFKVVLPTR